MITTHTVETAKEAGYDILQVARRDYTGLRVIRVWIAQRQYEPQDGCRGYETKAECLEELNDLIRVHADEAVYEAACNAGR